MYARKQLDIDYGDLLAGCIACFRPWKAARLHQELAAQWNDADNTLPALSVRTAFDAWLTTLNLPHGSEVVASGINIPDMARILENEYSIPVIEGVSAAVAWCERQAAAKLEDTDQR